MGSFSPDQHPRWLAFGRRIDRQRAILPGEPNTGRGGPANAEAEALPFLLTPADPGTPSGRRTCRNPADPLRNIERRKRGTKRASTGPASHQHLPGWYSLVSDGDGEPARASQIDRPFPRRCQAADRFRPAELGSHSARPGRAAGPRQLSPTSRSGRRPRPTPARVKKVERSSKSTQSFAFPL